MTNSWWKRAIVLLTAILLVAGSFLAWTSYNYSYQLRRTVIEENSRSAQMWANFIESRTATVYEHIHELLVTIYNNTELRYDTPIMSAQTKIKIVDMMTDKLLVSDYADAFFVYDVQNDFYLFSAKQSLSGMDVIHLKNHLYESAAQQARPFGDKGWDLITVNSAPYFSKAVQLGKYIVGAVSSCGYYSIENNFSVLGQDVCCQLLIDDTFYDIGGTQTRGRWTDAAALSEGYRDGFVTVTAQAPVLDAQVVLSAAPSRFQHWVGGSLLLSILLMADSALLLILTVGLLVLLRRKVALPTKALIHANRELAGGNTDFRLRQEDSGSQEFGALYDSFNTMAEQIVTARIQAYDMKLREEQSKLTLLRAQVKPHTFLNAITTISNMTYINKPEEIRSYITTFAKFMRYMLKVTSTWTTVAGELDHIRNYLEIQKVRSPGSIRCEVHCDEAVRDTRIPFLVLYTLVENSIKHAMTLYETMDITLRCSRVEEPDFSGILLVEEDSGAGFPPEILSQLLGDDADALSAKDHLGLSNVRYTLNLVYHRGDLLRLSNREGGGARVEIRIPDQEVTE